MPDANGKYFLSDYIAELQARGFDGFSAGDLTTYVNRGYFNVARRSTWYWEQTSDAFTILAGASSVPLWPGIGGELPNFKTLDQLIVTTAGSTKKLKPLSDSDFFDNWLWKDLTSTQYRGEPSRYYIYQGRLYVTPPPLADRTFLAYYHQRTSALVNPTDQPITPQHLDEAILIAATIRCHDRANEPQLAQLARANLEEFFDDMRDDEEEIMGEQQDRVKPDRSWL